MPKLPQSAQEPITTVPALPRRAAGRLLWRETATATYLEPTLLHRHPHLRCGFTSRHAGPTGQGLNLSFDRGDRATVLANRQHVLQAMALAPMPLYTVRQVHGDAVCVVDATARPHDLQSVAADALVSNLPDVALGILVADCLPIVLYSMEAPVIGVVHAGRLGTFQFVVQQTIETMARHFATPPSALHAVLGPAIGACCYTLDIRAVGPFQERFPTWEQFFQPHTPGRWRMDLLTANILQLRAAGIPAAQIANTSLCTVCHHHDLYSHRAEGQEAGRGMAIIARRATAP